MQNPGQATYVDGAARLLRMLICLATAGFVYPNVFIENIPVTKSTWISEADQAKRDKEAQAKLPTAA